MFLRSVEEKNSNPFQVSGFCLLLADQTNRLAPSVEKRDLLLPCLEDSKPESIRNPLISFLLLLWLVTKVPILESGEERKRSNQRDRPLRRDGEVPLVLNCR